MTKRISHTDFKKLLLSQKSTALEYYKLEKEFHLLQEMIKTQKKSELTKKQPTF